MGLGSSIVTTYCRCPNHPGKRYFARRLAGWFLSERGAPVTLRDGTRLWLNPVHPEEFAILQKRSDDSQTLSFVRANIQAGQLVLCAGVGSGSKMIVLSKLVGPAGKVVGIDPCLKTLLKVQENILANNLPDNVVLIPGRLGAQPAILPETKTNSTLTKSPKTKGMIHVIVESLPELLYRLGQRRVELFILDRPGEEKEIIQGITPASRPRTIMIPSTPEMDAAPLFHRLVNLGYRLFDLIGTSITSNDSLAHRGLVATDRDDLHWIMK